MVSVDAILKRIAVKRSFADHHIAIPERGRLVISSPDVWRVLVTADEAALNRLGLRLGAQLNNDDIERVLTSGNVVGSARLISESGTLSIVVEPKVPAYRLIGIIEYLQCSGAFAEDIAEAYGAHSDLLSLQIYRCINLVLASMARGSIRGYMDTQEPLACIKGRPDLVGLVRDASYIVQPSVTCQYSNHTINTPRNQVYRAALVKCAKVLGERVQTTYRDSARMGLYALSSVDDVIFSQDRIDKIMRTCPRDSSALAACRDVICGLSISPHPGIAKEFFSYAVNMATMFEDYCRGLLSVALSRFSIRMSEELTYPIDGGLRSIELDGLFGKSPQQIIIECKYKDVRTTLDVGREDVFQTVAYCNHVNLQPEHAIIMVPSFSGARPVQALGTIDGFRVARGKIRILAISLSHHPKEVERDLETEMSELLCK